MKLTEDQAFKIIADMRKFFGEEFKFESEDLSDYVMLKLINLELN